MSGNKKYGCADYRDEMMLVRLKHRLNDPGLTDREREEIETEIRRLEKKMRLD